MSVNIIEYKQTILEMFRALTETEIEVTKDVMNSDRERNGAMGSAYLLAINRCRQILEIILEGTANE